MGTALIHRSGLPEALSSYLNQTACKGVYKTFPVIEKLDAASS